MEVQICSGLLFLVPELYYPLTVLKIFSGSSRVLNVLGAFIENISLSLFYVLPLLSFGERPEFGIKAH